MLKKLFFTFIFLLIAGIAFIAIAPRMVDTESYKQRLLTEVRNATGLEPIIEGDVTASVLFTPTITIKGFSLPAPSEAFDEKLLIAPAITIRSSLASFLTGDIQINAITLQNPAINIEIQEDGTWNWSTLPAISSGSSSGLSLRTAHGIITYYDKGTGNLQRFEHVTGQFNASSLSGPFAFNGEFYRHGAPYTIKGDITKAGETRLNVDASIGREGGTVTLQGFIDGLGTAPLPSMDLALAAQGSDMVMLFSEYAPSMIEEGAPEEGKFTFSGKLISDGSSMEVKDVILDGESITAKASGSFAMHDNALKGQMLIDVDYLDLDHMVRRGVADSLSLFDIPTTRSSIDFSLNIKEIQYNLDYIRNLSTEGTLLGGVLEFNTLRANLPGETELAINGKFSRRHPKTANEQHTRSQFIIPEFIGTLEARGKHMASVLKWLDIDVSGLNPKKLGRYAMEGSLRLAPQRLELFDTTLQVDNSYVEGDFDIRYGTGRRIAVFSSVIVDRLNIDDYRKPENPNDVADIASTEDWLRYIQRLPFDLNIDAHIDTLTLAGLPIEDIQSVIVLTPEVIALEQVSLRSPLADFDGELELITDTLSPSIRANLNARHLDTGFFSFYEDKIPEQNANTAQDPASAAPDKTLPNLSWIGKYNGFFSVVIDRLTHNTLTLDKVEISGEINEGSIDVKQGKANIGDADLAFEGSMRTDNTPVIGFSFGLSNFIINDQFAALHPLFHGLKKGYMSVSGTFGTYGKTYTALLEKLNGSASIAARNVIVDNFDLHSTIKNLLKLPLDRADALIKQTLKQGTTEIYSVDGAMTVREGVVQIPQIVLTTNMSSGTLSGTIDLVRAKLNTISTFDFLILDPATNQKPKLTVGVKFTGNVDNPYRQTDYRSLTRYLSRRKGEIQKANQKKGRR